MFGARQDAASPHYLGRNGPAEDAASAEHGRRDGDHGLFNSLLVGGELQGHAVVVDAFARLAVGASRTGLTCPAVTTIEGQPAPGVGPWRARDEDSGVTPHEPFPDDAVGGSVTDRFLAVAAQHASATALSSPAGSWTYAELRDDVLRIASSVTGLVDELVERGDEPTPVAVVAEHDGPLVASMLGIIAAGHIVVVLDPAAPAPQTDHVLRECGAPLVLYDAAHADWVAERIDGPRSVAFDALDAAPGPLPPRTADAPLMLAFTSGTTGESKAAIITHGVVLNLVRGATNILGIGPDDRMPMLFPTSLAVAAYPMFLPLLNGGTLATLDVRSVGLAPVADFLEHERITVAYMAPTVVRFLVDALAGRTFPDLRLIALGGELVDREIFGVTAELFGPRWMGNGYGTTETGVITLWVQDADEVLGQSDREGAVPVGYPVPEVEITILDDNAAPLPRGQAGEIAVLSPYVFSGYWNHPELNAIVLSHDPRGRARWRAYRTGDYGRLDDNGALVVLGRIDTRVKVRGRPVMLGDVEAAVQQLEAVTDAVVVADTIDGNVELTAYVVPAAAFAGVQELRAAMLEQHETYRVPSHWVVLDELPRLPNGKVDRRVLPSVRGAATPGVPDARTADRVRGVEQRDDDDSHDRSDLRRKVQDIWVRLFRGENVGLDDDFVYLGGDSLMAAEMLLIIERELGVTVPMGELVHARTVRSLTEVLVRLRYDDTSATTAACVNPGDPASRPRLWFMHDLQGSAYRVRHLADALGGDQPVWSFESPLLAGEPNHYRHLAPFVARYVEDLKAAQPEGPYWLAGYSFGGICAYEMARQLVANGDEVAFLGVVDVGPGYRGPGWHGDRSPLRPWFSVAKPPDPTLSVKEKAGHYRAMLEQGPKRTVRHFMVRTGVARLVDPYRFRQDLRHHGRIRAEWRLWYAWEEHWKLAAKGWDRSSTYAGPLHLFWGSESGSSDATMGWEPLVGELSIVRFPGDHMGILEPRGAAFLAEVLRAAIDAEGERR
jgi:amino acid adenylation domain-containing protein